MSQFPIGCHDPARFLRGLSARPGWPLFLGLIIAAAISIAAPAQTLKLSPASLHPSQTTNVSGTKFGPHEVVDIYLDATDTVLGLTSSTGALPAYAITVPANSSLGTHWITAIGRKSGLAAQSSLTVNTDWTEFGFGAAGKQYNPYENVLSQASVTNLGLAWKADLGAPVRAAPAVSGGMVYVGSNTGFIVALNASTGAEVWAKGTAGAIESSPAVAGGIVYAGSDDDILYALNARTGAVVWTAGPIGDFVQTAPLVSGGIVYWGTRNGSVYAVNAKTGVTVWTVSLGGQIGRSFALANGQLFATSTTAGLCALSTSSGSQAFCVAGGEELGLNYPTASQELIYATALGHGIFAWPQASGLTTYTFSCGIQGYSVPTTFADSTGYFSGCFNGSGGTDSVDAIRFPGVNNIDEWTAPAIVSFPTGPMSYANGVLYVPQGGSVTALASDTGYQLWAGYAGSLNYDVNFVVVADGMLFASCDDGYLRAYALHAGDDPAYRHNPKPPVPSFLLPDGRLKIAQPAPASSNRPSDED